MAYFKIAATDDIIVDETMSTTLSVLKSGSFLIAKGREFTVISCAVMAET